MSECRGDGALPSGLDVERRQREPLSLLSERARSRRQAFAFGERALQRLQPLAREARLLAERSRARPERARRARAVDGQAPARSRSRAVPPRSRAAARAVRVHCEGGRASPSLPRAGRRRLRAPPPRGAAPRAASRAARPRACARAAAAVRLLSPSSSRSRRASRSSSATRARNEAMLAAQLLGALGRGRLQRERAETLLHLRLDVACALDLDRDARELQLGAMLAPLEPPEPRRLLEQLAPFLRLRAEDLLDTALADDRVHPAAEAEVGEQLDEVDAADSRAVEQVLALAAAVQPARDRQLRVGQRPFAVRVVEQQLDLAEVLGASGRRHPRTRRRPASRPAAPTGPASRPPRRSRRRRSTCRSRSARRPRRRPARAAPRPGPGTT